MLCYWYSYVSSGGRMLLDGRIYKNRLATEISEAFRTGSGGRLR